MKEDKGKRIHEMKDAESNSSSTTDSRDWNRKTGEYVGEYPYFLGIGSWTPQSRTRSEEVVSTKALSSMEAAFTICVLEDTLDELSILKYTIGAPVLSSWDFHYKPPPVRLRRKLTSTRIFPEVDSKPDLTPAIKLQRDREYIETIVRKLARYLIEDYSFAPLVNAVHDLRKCEEDDVTLIQDLKNHLSYMKELSAAVKEKRRLDDLEEKGRDELLYQLQDEVDDVILKCDVEERFVSKWENVRKAQNQWRLKSTENFYRDNITKFAAKMKMEKRATHEFQMYLKANQAELEEQLEEWMSLYDSEMERRENKILHMKYSRDQAEEHKNRLNQLLEERKQEMKDWVAFREMRKRRSAASLVIQNWWRGVMVRKKLGPYKPKKPKEEGKTKKKK